MKAKMKIKMGIDFLMTVLLFLLMSYQITGQELHEWFGAEMLVLFLLHNILNIRWYGSLFKGKYTLLRVMQMIINISVLISMLCLGFSGVVMSRHVFAGLSHPRTDGNSENHAPGGILLGICADEYSFRISLEHGSWTVPQTLEQKENPCYICMADAFYSNFYCGVRSVLFP